MSNPIQDIKANQLRRDSAGSDRLGELHMGTPGEKFDAMEFQKELEYAALFNNKDRRESSGSDRLGELKTTVGAHFDAEEYQRKAGK